MSPPLTTPRRTPPARRLWATTGSSILTATGGRSRRSAWWAWVRSSQARRGGPADEGHDGNVLRRCRRADGAGQVEGVRLQQPHDGEHVDGGVGADGGQHGGEGLAR